MQSSINAAKPAFVVFGIGGLEMKSEFGIAYPEKVPFKDALFRPVPNWIVGAGLDENIPPELLRVAAAVPLSRGNGQYWMGYYEFPVITSTDQRELLRVRLGPEDLARLRKNARLVYDLPIQASVILGEMEFRDAWTRVTTPEPRHHILVNLDYVDAGCEFSFEFGPPSL